MNGLIEALRRELQQYGEMLARFDDAAANHTSDAAEGTLVWVKAGQEQEGIVEMTIRKRLRVQRRLARHLRLPEDAGLTNIIPLLPREFQLLIRALMDENNELSAHVKQRTYQQRQLLRRSLHLMESCLVDA